jgi:CDP-glucose 4,6-dehydratase
MIDLQKVFRDKKILLTGHTGFKGSWMLAFFSLMGAKVKGYALETKEDSLYQSIGGDQLCDSVIADIRDQEKIKSCILEYQPDYIFHLAAQPLVLDAYRNPIYTHEVNIMGTAYILDALRELMHPTKLIVVTTDKVYENREWVYPYREVDPLGGYDPYSASKAGAELVTASYRNSYFHPSEYQSHQKSVTTARAGNVIGGGDWSDNRIIPDTVRALLAQEPLVLRNPNAVRPWQHVLEALHGYLLLAARLANEPASELLNAAWNFGPLYDENVTVREMAEHAIKVWGIQQSIKIDASEIYHEAGLLKLDSTKAHTYLKWHPRWTALESVQQTINWYKAVCLEQRSAFEVTIDQAKQYFNL